MPAAPSSIPPPPPPLLPSFNPTDNIETNQTRIPHQSSSPKTNTQIMMALQSNLSPSSAMAHSKIATSSSQQQMKPSQQPTYNNNATHANNNNNNMNMSMNMNMNMNMNNFGSTPPTPAHNGLNSSLMANANWMCSLSPGIQPLFRADYKGSEVQFNTFQVVPGFEPQMQANGCIQQVGFPVQEQTLGKKPPYSFPCLIGLALRSCESGRMSVSQIYDHITGLFPYFRTAKAGWKNSVRHNLSLNKIFCKLERLSTEAGKGAMWGIAPGMKEQLERDITQCQQRYPQKIAEAMKEPEQPTPGQQAAQQQRQPMQLQMMGTNAQGQIIFGTSPRSVPPSLGDMGRASSAPTMPMVMMAQPGQYGNGMSFASPPKAMFNPQPTPTQNAFGAPSSQQVTETPDHSQAGVMAPNRRLSLPDGMEQFMNAGDFTINDLIQTGTLDQNMASPTKILGGYDDHMDNNYVPALYDSSSLLTDGADGFSLNNLGGYDDDNMKQMLGGLVHGPTSIKMEMDNMV